MGKAENAVQTACLRYLHLDGHLAWRSNTGALRNPAGRLVRFGVPGLADIIGVLRPSGVFLAVECKAPGRRNSPTLPQTAFLQAVRQCGGFAVCVESASDLHAALALFVSFSKTPMIEKEQL